MTPEEKELLQNITPLGLAGFLAGLGVLLASKEVLTMRIIVGRAISSTALGIGSTAVLAIVPHISETGQIGIACLVASLGTSGLERLLQKWRS